ncbi:DMT family transporter [Effusibacillus lacus]|uniref:EamA domain-containing protein n=1 Tax=Effusibacillus lacus TaxID=1348429 RepID=A0A292YSF0_9BACL|nr:DMT family transporter [Effusibacillus lacus]TCS76139.1 putative membrane protein [Effusibacillus lacus]GAX91354.1 hypothetical protein EFBL_3023 [Effusibacillus lacus]
MGELVAVMAAASFAAANVMVKKGTTASSRDNGVFVSILLTAAISGLIVIAAGIINGFPTLTKEGVFWFVLAGVFTSFIGRIWLYSSIQHLGSVRASAVKRLNPFFTVLIGLFFLGDPLTIPLLIGMLMIFSGFIVMIIQSFRSSAKGNAAATVEPGRFVESHSMRSKIVLTLRSIANLGYMYGPISALAYAVGYALRKKGLLEIPDPFFGTMLGAGVGALIFAVMALFQDRYRASVKSAFFQFRPWLFFAGIATSTGQILYFMALNLITVSSVALIASTEVVFTFFLSAWVFHTQEEMTKTTIAAAFVSMTGAAVIALG